ncbi:MAG: TonB family protein [Terracidiphilus sp.]
MTVSESWILSYLVNSLWQAPLLFAAGLLAARALRSAGPEAEHRVWIGVLLLQSIVPACSAAHLSWFHALLIWSRGTRSAAEGQVTVLMGNGVAAGAFSFPSAVFAAIALAYCAITFYFAARFVWRWSRLNAMRRESAPMTLVGESGRCWAECSKRFAVRNASLATSSRVFAPVTLGIVRKLLLLPSGIASRISEAEMQSVIAHEFAHMRRNDFLKNLFYELLSLPVSYHPILWLTRAKITESREIVCDRMAAEFAGRDSYSSSLLRLASLLIESTPAKTAHALGIFDSNILERRLMKLAENRPEIRGLRRFGAIVACLALGAATCASALALHVQINGVYADSQHSSVDPAFINVSPKTMESQLIHKVNPKYPVEAKKAHIEGEVVLSATINEQGNVQSLNVDSGPKELQKPSLDAVGQWKYKPYLRNGEPVVVTTKVNIYYCLGRLHPCPVPWEKK